MSIIDRSRPIEKSSESAGISKIVEIILGTVNIKEGKKNVPLDFQISLLGLDNSIISKLNRKRHLDIGCGNGELVKYLRSKGVESEGIDSVASAEDFFIRRDVKLTGGGINDQGIPRPNNHYDLITSCQNTSLNYGFDSNLFRLVETAVKREGYSNDEYLRLVMLAKSLISEMVRTIKPNGQIIIFPNLPRIEEEMQMLFNAEQVNIKKQKIGNQEKLRNYLLWEIDGNPNDGIKVYESKLFDSYTILRKG